jgi:protein CpxP
MKTLKIYKVLLVILVIVNVVTLSFLLMKPDHPPMPPERINLAEKLGMSGEKAKDVTRIQKEHHREMHRLNQQIKQLHHQLFRAFQKDSSSVLKTVDLVIENRRKAVLLLYNYYSELNTYCTVEQRKILDKHLKEVILRNGSPSRPKR